MCYSTDDCRTICLHSFRDLAMNQGDHDQNKDIPPRSSEDSTAMGQRVYDTARVQRSSQVAFIRDRLDLSPAAVAGVAAIIAQIESQIQAPMLTISITSGFPGFQRSMTFQDGVWSGHDLTHHFTDDRAATSYTSANGGVHQTRTMQVPSCPPPPPPPPPTSNPEQNIRAREPPGSPVPPPAPIPPNLVGRPIAEQAVISALQAIAVNPCYTDFMRSMEQCWPELRQIALPTVTIQNENAIPTQPAMIVPHVNLLSEQPGHSRTVTIERSRSPSRSSSSHKGGEERRPFSRKRNDRSPTRVNNSTMQPLTTRDSPSSKPPPDKKISNEELTPTSVKTPTAASSSHQPKTKVLEAPGLPPPLLNQPSKPQELPQPPPSQPTSRESLAHRAIPKPSSSKHPQTDPTIGYQGTPQAQRTVQVIMGDYPDLKVTNSGPTGTPLRKQAIQHPTKRTFTKQPTHLSPMQNTQGSLVTKDARRIWESAVIVSPEWLFEKNMCPPSDEQHATLKKLMCQYS